MESAGHCGRRARKGYRPMSLKKKYVPTPAYDEAAFVMFQDQADVPEYVVAALKAAPSLTLDTNETLVFARSMETVRNKVYRKVFAELIGTSLVPMSEENAITDEWYIFRAIDSYTLATLYENYATDMPLVTASAREVAVKFYQYWNGYGWSTLDAMRAARAGVALGTELAMACRKGHEIALDEQIAKGVPSIKTFGLVNHPNVSLYAMPTGAWTTATSDQILADMNAFVTQMLVGTLETFAPDTYLMDTAAYRLITSKLMNSASGGASVLETFQKQNPGITVKTWTKLATANAAGTNGRQILYKNSEEVLQFIVGKQFESFPAETANMFTKFPTMSSAAGLQVFQPLAIAYSDNALV
jgi:hypothetical protein